MITLGSKGSVILTNKNKLFVSALEKVNVVDTTGGGDAFIAGFLYGYLNNQSLRDSAEIGTALSSFIIEKVGCLTNIPSKYDLLVRKEKIGELYNNDTANIILRAYQ
ncbi:carbohydrate kinase family protein [Globicatella sanguinis]